MTTISENTSTSSDLTALLAGKGKVQGGSVSEILASASKIRGSSATDTVEISDQTKEKMKKAEKDKAIADRLIEELDKQSGKSRSKSFLKDVTAATSINITDLLAKIGIVSNSDAESAASSTAESGSEPLKLTPPYNNGSSQFVVWGDDYVSKNTGEAAVYDALNYRQTDGRLVIHPFLEDEAVVASYYKALQNHTLDIKPAGSVPGLMTVSSYGVPGYDPNVIPKDKGWHLVNIPNYGNAFITWPIDSTPPAKENVSITVSISVTVSKTV